MTDRTTITRDSVRFEKIEDGGHEPGVRTYRVMVDSEQIGEVGRHRVNAGRLTVGTVSNRTERWHGKWTWWASPAPEDEYNTRQEAVDDMLDLIESRTS